jgi:predicted transcriptional regulator
MSKKGFNIRLDTEIIDRADAVAEHLSLKRIDIIRMALREYLTRAEQAIAAGMTPEESNRLRSGLALSLLGQQEGVGITPAEKALLAELMKERGMGASGEGE